MQDAAAAPPGGVAGVPGPGIRLAAPLATALAALVGTAYVAAVDPNQTGHYPTCPFLFVTGLYCPGCGSLRAVHALAHAHVAEALARNPLTVVAVPLLLVLWALWTRREITGRPRDWAAPGWAVWAAIGVVLAFWVLRNLPGLTFLGP